MIFQTGIRGNKYQRHVAKKPFFAIFLRYRKEKKKAQTGNETVRKYKEDFFIARDVEVSFGKQP